MSRKTVNRHRLRCALLRRGMTGFEGREIQFFHKVTLLSKRSRLSCGLSYENAPPARAGQGRRVKIVCPREGLWQRSNGDGAAASTRYRAVAGFEAATPQLSNMPAPASKLPGTKTYPAAPTATSASTAGSGTSLPGNTSCMTPAFRCRRKRAVDGHAVSVAPRSISR